MSEDEGLSMHPAAVSARRWKAKNPERHAELQRASRRRKRERTPCRQCGGPMPYPSPGASYCSEDCRTLGTRAWRNSHRQGQQDRLTVYKLQHGCERCGYRHSARALHFHHRDPSLKTMRITCKQFVADTERTRRELANCVLLCANCHAEAHDEDTKIAANGDVFTATAANEVTDLAARG